VQSTFAFGGEAKKRTKKSAQRGEKKDRKILSQNQRKKISVSYAPLALSLMLEGRERNR
jgi:hypothetical protein